MVQLAITGDNVLSWTVEIAGSSSRRTRNVSGVDRLRKNRSLDFGQPIRSLLPATWDSERLPVD